MDDWRIRKYIERQEKLKELGIIAEGTVNNFKKPKKMKSKIEKLPSFYLTENCAVDYFNREKINEIIDYLNSQDQPEEKEPLSDCCGASIDGFNGEIGKCRDCKEGCGIMKQEENKDWREELGKLMATWGKVLYVNDGRIGRGMQVDMRSRFEKFIEQEKQKSYEDGIEQVKSRLEDIVFEYHDGDILIRDFDLTDWFHKIVDKLLKQEQKDERDRLLSLSSKKK